MFSKSFLHKICEYRIYILSLQNQTIINNVVMSNDKKTIKEMRANDMTPAFPTHPGDVLKDEI